MKPMNQGVGRNGYFEQHYGGRDWRFYRSILTYVLRYSEPGPILDVGAGTGLFVEAATRWGLSCMGLEGSAEAIEIARIRYPQGRMIHHLLSEPWPVQPGSFQTVILNQVIEHLESEVGERCLQEAHGALAARGMLFVASPCKYNKQEADADPTHINLYTPARLRALLRSCGYERIIPQDHPLDVLGSSRLADAVMGVVWRLTRWDRLSATANCIAFKSSRPTSPS